jgi:methyl-accepting chemotaxis protein
MRIRLREKLLAGFGAVIVLLAVVAVLGIMQLQSASNRTSALYRENVLGVQYALATNVNMIASAREEKRAFLTDDVSKRTPLIEASRAEMAKAQEYLLLYHDTFASEADAEQWAPVEDQVNKVVAAREEVLTLLEQGKDDEAAIAAATMTDMIAAANKALDDAGQFNADLAASSKDAAASAAASSRTMMIAISVVAALVGFGIAYWLARSIAGAAGKAAAAADSISRGDVNVKVDVNSKDEMGDLARAFTEMTGYLAEMVSAAEAVSNGDLTTSVTPRGADDALGNALSRMVTNLQTLIGQVKENSDSILNAAVQLGDSSDQMAAATGQIATAINEVTRSAVSLSGLSQDSAREIERVASGSQQVAAGAATSADSAAQSRQEAVEMGERIQVVATASKEVAQAAEESRSAAQQGQQAVGQAVSSMESIATAVQRASRTVDQLGEYGQQIGDIVKAIDEIAAQTNLLALNAAIEAARAGEQGRGFAVVAENVRSLAERSSESTKEIAALIAKVQSGTQEAVEAMAVGVRDVQEGQRITEEAGQSLTSIIGTVELSATRMQEIARDVQGLASGAERIISSAEGIADLAKESAAGAGEMAAGTTRVTEAIIQVSATSEETSASAEEVSASTEELSAQSEELAATANQMREMAEALQKASARFKLA